MKPCAFNYERPGTVEAATDLLSETGVFAKAVAGSQSLGPMLNLRLAQPELLVDITAIPELRKVEVHGEMIEFGACVTHADIEDGRVPEVANGFLGAVAGGIAYRAVRNRGTIGGSLAHADPAADWVSVFPLLGAEIRVRSGSGPRTIAAEELVVSSFLTALRNEELIVSVGVPRLSPDVRWGFCKLNQKAGEFAHAIGGILHDPDSGRFRAVIGAIETAPIVVPDARALFGGEEFGAGLADRLDETEMRRMLDASGVHDNYTRRLAVVALRRAARQASAP